MNADNYAKSITSPVQKIDKGELNGKTKNMYDSITLDAELALNDEILLPNLPEGARVIEAIIKSPSLGATGILSLGHKAGVTEVEDDNAFIPAADAGGQAVVEKMSGTLGNVGHFKKFGETVQLFAKCTEASAAGTGAKIEFLIQYVVD